MKHKKKILQTKKKVFLVQGRTGLSGAKSKVKMSVPLEDECPWHPLLNLKYYILLYLRTI